MASSPGGRAVRIVRAGRGDLLQQQLVDARAVEVDDLDPPAAPLEMLTDVGDTAELGDDHSRGGVVFVLVLQRQHAGAEQFAQVVDRQAAVDRSEEHTSELQSLMRISYSAFSLKKKTSMT